MIRFEQHVVDQPWGDTIPELNVHAAIAAGYFVIDADPYPNKAAVWVAEAEAIRRDRPLYNIEYNLDNPDQIPQWEAHRQRAVRDVAAGIPYELSWAVLYRQRKAARDQVAVVPAGPVRRWLPAWPGVRRLPAAYRRAAAWAVGWAAATVPLWWLAVHYVGVLSVWRLGVLAGLLVAWTMVWANRPRRDPWRRAGNLAVRCALAFLAGLVVYGPFTGWLNSP